MPCLDYHIGRCAAPCVGLITHEAYRAVIDDVIAFLEGRTNRIERDLERLEGAADDADRTACAGAGSTRSTTSSGMAPTSPSRQLI